MPKLILVTYYWPPSNNVGTYRWLYFTKYFAEFGANVSVVYPKNAAYATIDEALQEDISDDIHQIGLPIIEPNQLLKPDGKSGSAFAQPKSLLKKAMLHLRANYFIPDARVLFVKPTVNYLKKFISNHPQDIMITNGPPHSIHLIGLALKQHFPHIKWIADFRDPWQEIDYFDELPLNKKALSKHQELEKKVLQTANAVTTVSPSWQELFEQKGAKKVFSFTNGFTENLTLKTNKKRLEQQQEQRLVTPNQPLLFRHVGSINQSRNPSNFWDYLQESEHPIQVELIGACSADLQEKFAASSTIKQIAPVAHSKALDLMAQSDVLLLLNNTSGANKGRIPAKLFEYIATQKPILYFGELNNDAAKMIQSHNLGQCLSYSSTTEEIATAINQLLQQPIRPKNIDQFERRTIAKDYYQFITELL